MKKTDGFAVAAGVILTVLGAVLLVVSLFFWPVVFYGVGALVVGIVILATLKQQEHIEPIKNKRNKNRKE